MNKVKNLGSKGNNEEVRKHIKDLCEQIVRAVQPQKIILFGSQAYGTPHEDSDVDLLVIMPFQISPHRQAFNIRMQVETPLALDLLVRTPEVVEERIKLGDSFLREIVEQGQVIYESADIGMGDKSRGRLGAARGVNSKSRKIRTTIWSVTWPNKAPKNM
jgi:predicted nucleotidyltransferase